MKKLIAVALLLLAAPAFAEPQQRSQQLVVLPDGVDLKEASWFSEQVASAGRLYTPAGFTEGSSVPGIVLAPDSGQTADTLSSYAAALAGQGMVVLTMDYRGWGRSGGLLYLGERIDTYDKMRFSEQTPELIIRRGRIDPDHQVQDIRNAITYLQSIKGVDRARIGVGGVGLAGGHVVSVMSMDARAKAGVAITPSIPGANEEELAFAPDAATQAKMIRLARQGAPPRTANAMKQRNKEEGDLLLAEYKPFWRLDAIPETAAIRFIIAGSDDKVNNAVNAFAAQKATKAKSDVRMIEGAKHALTPDQRSQAAELAAAWFKVQFTTQPAMLPVSPPPPATTTARAN